MADLTPDPSGPSGPLEEFGDVMRRLRAECPWKRAQTHRSLVRYLLEEAHETVEAIEAGTVADLREELGDLLLQVYFHAVIAEEDGDFTLDDVAADVAAKMRRRNPHVFGPDAGTSPADAASVNELWESVKAAEKDRDSVLDGLAPSLPALLYADKVVDRLKRSGALPAAPRSDPASPLLVLVPSPFLGPATWRPVAWWLEGRGHDVVVADLGSQPRTPSVVIEGVRAAAAERPVVLVMHSNAGLYGPHLAAVLDVRATIYVDAALPLPPAESEVALAPPALRDSLAALAVDGVLPVWTTWWEEADAAALFPDAATRAAVEAEQVPIRLDYLDQRVPVPPEWDTTPSAYLAFGDTYDAERTFAAAAGWPVRSLDGNHLHPLWSPAEVGAAIEDLLAALLPDDAWGERLLELVEQAHAAGVDPEQALRDAVWRLVTAAERA